MEPIIKQRYIDAGKVKLIWHDFAWIGEESRQAAQAARCAGQHGMFCVYHDCLYRHQRGENRGQFSNANLKTFAAEVGVPDPARFTACLDAGADLPEIRQALQDGRALGINATPFFVINGQKRAGAFTIAQLSSVLDTLLARRARGAAVIEASFAAALFTYALGTAAPLFILAWFWDRFNLGRRRWLRGRALRVGPLALHTTNLVAGLLFVLLGVSFIVFQGSSALSVTYDDFGLGELSFRAQSWVAHHTGGAADPALALFLIALVAGWWAKGKRAARRAQAKSGLETRPGRLLDAVSPWQ